MNNDLPTPQGRFDELVIELKSQCNRYTNATCQTLACLKRGGYKQGDTVNYSVATCKRYEQVRVLEALLTTRLARKGE